MYHVSELFLFQFTVVKNKYS